MDIPASIEEAKLELEQIEAWLSDVQSKLPAYQQRGIFLHGYLAALNGGAGQD